jgi:peroxiredoxin
MDVYMVSPRIVASRIFGIMLSLSIVLASVWLVTQVSNPGSVQNGGPLPAIQFAADDGQRQTVSARTNERTVILLVHSQCGHCGYELDEIERKISDISDLHLYVLSTEQNFFAAGFLKRFPKLRASASVSIGVVDRASFRRAFGVLVTPALFVFNERGRLVKSFRGETKIDAFITNRADDRNR